MFGKMIKITPLNLIFFITILSIVLMVFCSVPRELSLVIAGVLVFFVIFSPLEDSVILFIRLIPFFVALPLLDNFDSFNTWRIIVFAIFLKWMFSQKIPFKGFIKKYSIEFFGLILILISFLSLIKAPGTIDAIKKIIFFTNIFILFPVIVDLIKRKKELAISFIKSIAISCFLIVFIGYFQLISTYLLNIFDFVRFWAGKVQSVFFGESWVEIVKQKNTWFTYAGGFVKLRMFSTFPNSHSFPLFLIMCLPSLWFLFKKSRLLLTSFLLACFIFSGTRGIWLSIIFPIIATIYIFKKNKDVAKKTIPIFLIFIILIPIASAIIYLPQFRINEMGDDITRLLKRIRSGFNLSELSNQGRIIIFKESFKSIIQNPVLGVGIGNFPIILNEEIDLGKAGSSAHNIYLQIAAEIGLIALFISLIIILKLLKACWVVFNKNDSFKNFAWMSFICFL